jgi:hypothetical protein
MSAQSDFAAKVQELISQSKSLGVDARNKVLEILDAVRKEIIVRLAEMDPSSFNTAQLTVLKHQVDGLMDKFRAQATSLVDDYESKAFTVGANTVSEPLATAGLESSDLGKLSTSALSIAQGYTADLITGLSKDASSRINAAIQRSFLGGQQITDIIAQIGKALGGNKGFTGLFSSIGKRATGITLNEVLRVGSIATQARLEDAAERHSDLQKQWHHLAIAKAPRPGHLLADDQVVDVAEAFQVEGEDLMYPRDPNGSPENTINCHCMMAPYFAADALKPSEKQKGLLESLGISVSAA